MKAFRMLPRYIRDAFKSIFRNFSLSLASISCITITLIIVALSIVASLNVENFTKEIEKDMTIVVFLDNDSNEDDIKRINTKIKDLNNVDTYQFKSKASVKADMSKESEVFDTILSELGDEDSPLKDTYQVKVKDVLKIKNTAEEIKKISKVSTVRYGEGMVETLISAFQSVEKVSLWIVIALVIVTVFLIVNTIKLTIFSRKQEISIMRLVGSSNISIKIPFIIEGIILGLIGTIIPVVIIIFGYTAFYNHFDGYLFSKLIRLVSPKPFIYSTSGIVILVGIIVGMIGSARAVRKYLKI